MATENLSRISADFETQLSGAISVGGSSFTLQSIEDLDGNDLSDGIYCFTIDRDNTNAKEYLIGQLTASTKTVASISSVSRQGVLSSNAQKSHRIGANVIISDHSILVALSRIFTGQGTINPSAPLEYTTEPTLSSATQIATKGYVDSVVSGGTVNTDRVILGSQTAGETVAAGNIVYFKSSDSRWWKADADLTATFSNVQLGVALGAGTAGNTISGGVLIYGKCDSFSGLTATSTYYLSNTAGEVSTSAGTFTIKLGQAFSTTGIFFNPNTTLSTAVSTSAGASDSGKVPLLGASGTLDDSFINSSFANAVKKVGTSGSTSEIANNTTTETTIFSQSIDGGSLSTSNALRFKLFISGFATGLTSVNLTLRLKYGSTTVATVVIASSGGTVSGLKGFVEGVLIANASTSAQTGTLFVSLADDQTNPHQQYDNTASVEYAKVQSSGTATENSANTLNLALTAQWSSADNGNDLVPAGYIVELIK